MYNSVLFWLVTLSFVVGVWLMRRMDWLIGEGLRGEGVAYVSLARSEQDFSSGPTVRSRTISSTVT